MKNNLANEKIDFVVLWVDGNDKEWQKEKSKYDLKSKKEGINGVSRYRDWDNLKYWFRGVETFAPWVNNVYFITWGHLPKWLNTSNPKLKIINHKDYIPSKYLPVFSSHPIEFNIHRIKGLSEQFVLFNDDMFITNYVSKKDFFINGMPCDNYCEFNLDYSGEDETFACILKNNYDVLNRKYNKRKVLLKHLFKYFNPKYGIEKNLRTLKTTITHKNFAALYNPHIPQPFLKKYFKKTWIEEKDLLDETCSHRFRSKKDVSQYLIRYFQLLDGVFVPRNYKWGRYFSVSNNNEELVESIKSSKYNIVCINDSDKSIDFEKCKSEINSAFDTILGEKSSFEK